MNCTKILLIYIRFLVWLSMLLFLLPHHFICILHTQTCMQVFDFFSFCDLASAEHAFIIIIIIIQFVHSLIDIFDMQRIRPCHVLYACALYFKCSIIIIILINPSSFSFFSFSSVVFSFSPLNDNSNSTEIPFNIISCAFHVCVILFFVF